MRSVEFLNHRIRYPERFNHSQRSLGHDESSIQCCAYVIATCKANWLQPKETRKNSVAVLLDERIAERDSRDIEIRTTYACCRQSLHGCFSHDKDREALEQNITQPAI